MKKPKIPESQEEIPDEYVKHLCPFTRLECLYNECAWFDDESGL